MMLSFLKFPVLLIMALTLSPVAPLDSRSPPHILSPPSVVQSSQLRPQLAPPQPPLISSPAPKTDGRSASTPVALISSVGSVAILLAMLGLCWYLCAKGSGEQVVSVREEQYKHWDRSKNGASAQSCQSNNLPSERLFVTTKTDPPPLAAVTSMLNAPTVPSSHSQKLQPLSVKESVGLFSNSFRVDSSFTSSMEGIILENGTTCFTYNELKSATAGFSSVNLLGQGGFGYVHKGILANGKIVAVKSLRSDSGQGDREFRAEVETISRVHHKHLVTLVGYCISGSQKLIVYDFVPNKTMEFHLYGKGQPVMDWPARLKIAVGGAKGLAYLHEDCHPKIIHRDIKAANILLDHTFEAQVADFGLAKFSSEANTHISTRIMGTIGYLAPEYASSGRVTDKIDVFSFGVLLLELITGRRPVNQMEDSLVDWARPLLSEALQDGNFDHLVDLRLGNNYNSAEMGAMISCAASCVHHSAKHRPRMSQIVWALQGNLALAVLNNGVTPGFSSIYSSSDIDHGSNKEGTSRLVNTVYESEDYDRLGLGEGTSSTTPLADLYPCPAPPALFTYTK